jgi:hypothetical protein
MLGDRLRPRVSEYADVIALNALCNEDLACEGSASQYREKER